MAYVEGLMMDTPLDISLIWRHASLYHAARPVVTRRFDRSIHRTTMGAVLERARRLGSALLALGVEPGDRVATLCATTYQHLEAFFAVAGIGAVVHTVNPRLASGDVIYLLNHADDRVVLVDQSLYPIIEAIRGEIPVRHVIVVGEDGPPPAGTLSYEAVLDQADPDGFRFVIRDERQAAALCYTSGTTGRPRGVLYSHRSMVLHALGLVDPHVTGMSGRDVACLIAPMYHVMGWGVPWQAFLQGTALVLPGRHLDPASLLELFASEKVTISCGVPTVLFGLLDALDAGPDRYDLSALRMILVGGAAVPEATIRAFDERHGVHLVHAWGMTETSPLGSVAYLPADLDDAPAPARYAYRASQGLPPALVQVRVRDGAGAEVPRDGRTMGELEVRGPWVARAYFGQDDPDRWTADGWLRTGDLATTDARGALSIHDRAKDVIKSGGEWISSVALENEIMAHPAVAEAAVVAMADPKWQERPLAVVVLRPGRTLDLDALHAFLGFKVPQWWLPDRMVVADALPRGAAGKVLKAALRARYAG